MARFAFRRPAPAGLAPDPDDPGQAAAGTASILAQRFGINRQAASGGAGGRAFLRRLNPLSLFRRNRGMESGPLAIAGPDTGRSRPGAFAAAVAATVLAAVGMLVWLAVTAPETLRRLQPRPAVVAPVLLPDGTPRFAEEVAAPVEPAEVDPVDLPVELSSSRNEAMLERGPAGYLPRVAEDGTAPWQYYARPFPHEDPRPRIAIVITDMGLSTSATEAAIARLPGSVTLAFAAGAPDLQGQIDRARADGHEVLLSVPMEPVGFPANDPGPGTLLSNLSDERNVSRLESALAAATGYVGLTSTTGSHFLTRESSVRPVLQQVQRRGLIYVDARPVAESQATRIATRIQLPRAVSDVVVDRVASPAGIDAQLAELERLAKANGVAVGYAQGLPVTLERLALWAETLRDRDIVLAPVTAVVNRQADR